MSQLVSLSASTLRHTVSILFAGVLAITSTPAFPASCSTRSGATRATLIELYTSEGCSSCPPADRWLSGFADQTVRQPSPVIPLAFHVDYWDSLGWRDRFASASFTARQYERVSSNRGSFAYTPQILVDGRDSNAWRQARAPGEIGSSAISTPGANLILQVNTRRDGKISVDLETKLLEGGDVGHAVVYLALFENGLSSNVRAGENAGHQLRHDFVVRDWVGPLPIRSIDREKTSHVFTPSDVILENAGVAAIVELADGSRLLQAISQPVCRAAQPS
jgi:hypothetical protein